MPEELTDIARGAPAPLRVGIAGYGVVGRRRRACIDRRPGLRTAALSDVRFESEGPDAEGVLRLRDYRSLLDQELDVLFVSLPNHLAAEATAAGLERGLHVFCEKPPGRDLEDVRRVIAAERRRPGLKLKYGFNHRYHASVAQAKNLVDGGRYGRIVNIKGIYGKSSIIPFAEGWRSQRRYAGGGILLDQGIHMLDMLLYLAGDFEEVKSFISNDYWGHDVEDNAYALLRSRSGCVAMIHSTATQWQHRFRLELTLEEGLVELTGILSGSKSYGEEKLRVVPRKDGSAVGSFAETTTSFLEDTSWDDEVREFADAVLRDQPISSGTSADALRVMDLVERIYRADEAWSRAHLSGEPRGLGEAAR